MLPLRQIAVPFLAPWNEDFESSDWVVPFSWFDQGDFGDCFLDSGTLSFYWRVSRTPYNQDAGPNTDHSPSGPGNYLATESQMEIQPQLIGHSPRHG